MSRGVINCAKQFLSHPFSRIKSLGEWAVDRDPVLSATTSAKIGKTAIVAYFHAQASLQLMFSLGRRTPTAAQRALGCLVPQSRALSTWKGQSVDLPIFHTFGYRAAS